MLFHNHGVFQRFVDELRAHLRRRRDRSTRRGAWSTGRTGSAPGPTCGRRTATGSRSTTWPGGRFQAKLTTEFIAWQAGIVREYARDDQFVTTCIAYERPTVDDANLTRALDVTAGNPYYAMQDALAVPSTGATRRRAGPPRAPGACS